MTSRLTEYRFEIPQSRGSYKIDKYLGANLTRHRQQAGISLAEMAEMLEENIDYCRELESGRMVFGRGVLVKTSKICGMPVLCFGDNKHGDLYIFSRAPDFLSSILISLIARELRTLENSRLFGWFCNFLKIERAF